MLIRSNGTPRPEHYECERHDLHDSWGGRQKFSLAAGFARLYVQISQHVVVIAVMQNNSDCLFKDGAAITARIRQFVQERLQKR